MKKESPEKVKSQPGGAQLLAAAEKEPGWRHRVCRQELSGARVARPTSSKLTGNPSVQWRIQNYIK